MKKLPLLLFCSLLLIAGAQQLRAGEPKTVAQEDIDPDVLRKVRKLINGTLSEETAEREMAWSEIKNMGNLVVPGLLGLYRQKETTAGMMRSIVIALGDSKDKRAGSVLAEMLTSKEASVRRDAARALGDSGYQDGRVALEAIAADEKEEAEVRLFAAVAGAKLGSEKAHEQLNALLKSTKPEIRSRSVFALGKYGGLKQAPAIEKALDDADSSVREDAVEALRLLGKKPAWGGLVKATGDEDYKVRNAAMNALKELTGETKENSKGWKDWWEEEKKKPETVKE